MPATLGLIFVLARSINRQNTKHFWLLLTIAAVSCSRKGNIGIYRKFSGNSKGTKCPFMLKVESYIEKRFYYNVKATEIQI